MIEPSPVVATVVISSVLRNVRSDSLVSRSAAVLSSMEYISSSLNSFPCPVSKIVAIIIKKVNYHHYNPCK